MVWHDKPETDAMTAVIGKAAQFDVMDEKFVRRRVDQPDPQNPAQVASARETAAK